MWGIWAWLLLAGSATSAGEPDPVLADMGRVYFARHCAACHGADARGDGPAAEALRKRPADLTRIAERRDGRFPEGEIAQFIDGRLAVPAHGAREMPVWGERFAEAVPDPGLGDEIARGKLLMLVEYLKTVQRRPSPIAPPE